MPIPYRLESKGLRVQISSAGAELTSITDQKGTEYLWQADPGLWPRHAPVLFPVVGRLKENRYTHKGTVYQMNQHGFARDQEFSCLEHNQNVLFMELLSNASSLQDYPFEFHLRIRYTLEGLLLRCAYEVHNRGADNMYFSLGAHPGFRLDSPENGFKPELRFDRDGLVISRLKEGLVLTEKSTINLHERRLPLDPACFEHDALVLEDGQIQSLSLIAGPNGRGLEMHCENWPYFGIWSKSSGGPLRFVCLEPWQGIADSYEHKGELARKKGIIGLERGQTFNCAYSIRFF